MTTDLKVAIIFCGMCTVVSCIMVYLVLSISRSVFDYIDTYIVKQDYKNEED